MFQPDGVVPDLFNPQAFNRYSFVVNNPVAYSDPSGMDYSGSCGEYCTVVVGKRESVGSGGFESAGVSWDFSYMDDLEAVELPGGGFDFRGEGYSPPPGPGPTNEEIEAWRRWSTSNEPADIGVLGRLLPAHMRAYYRGSPQTNSDPYVRFNQETGAGVQFGAATLGRDLTGISYAITGTALATAQVAMGASISAGVGSSVGNVGVPLAAEGTGAAAAERTVFARIFGKGGLLNSNRYLRIGVGRKGGESVFRIGGEWIERLTGQKHIDLWSRGPLNPQ
jgi:hypothetical protein